MPTVEVSIEGDEGKESFTLRSANLGADPTLRSMTQKAVSLMYAYIDVLTELIKMSAPVMAQRIKAEERYGASIEKRQTSEVNKAST